jgi:hypothetical protein
MTASQDPAPPAPDAAAKAAPAPDDEARAKALARYNETRDKTPMTAAAQSRLAAWCEQNGLPTEAYVHYANVVRLDPSRDAAWRKLGFKKYDGRWMTDEQVAEEVEQKKADAVWGKKFKDWHKSVHGGRKQAETQAALDEITEPRAVPSIYREFGASPRDQLIAVQLLGQIDAKPSSKALASLAVYGKSPEVRRRAMEILRRRPPEDFLDLLVALMSDPLKYEVRPVGGPGSPGVLFVEGARFNVQRFYAPPPPPNVTPMPGDQVSYDAFGMPVITRRTGIVLGKAGVPGSKTLVNEYDGAVQFSATQQMIQAQRATLSAQQQLAGDVAQVEAINEQRNKLNEVVIDVAKTTTGKDPGKTPKDWRDALAAQDNKYKKSPTKPKPTVNELVPLAYMPVYAQPTFLTRTIVDS